MPQLDFSSYAGQIFWLAVSFILLYTLVSKLILPSIGQVVEGRANSIAQNLNVAEDVKNQAAESDDKANKILAESTNKARGLIAESSAKAKTKIEAKRAELAQKLEQKIKKAESEIARIENESAAVIDGVVNELSNKIAQKVLKVA